MELTPAHLGLSLKPKSLRMTFKQQPLARQFKNIAGRKFTWCALSLAALTFTAFSTRPDISKQAAAATETSPISPELLAGMPPSIFESSSPFETFALSSQEAEQDNMAKQLVAYAKSLLGKPYHWGDTGRKGFDCSGFVYHIFNQFNLDVERSSRAQSTQGDKVDVTEAKPGDLLFFTGTNPKIRAVGHVGIVVSDPGEPVSFVHSSSNGGVKISELEGYYNTRFMFAKRVE